MKRVEAPLICFPQCDGARVCNLDRMHVGAGEGQVESPVCLRSIHTGKLCLRHRNLAISCVGVHCSRNVAQDDRTNAVGIRSQE